MLNNTLSWVAPMSKFSKLQFLTLTKIRYKDCTTSITVGMDSAECKGKHIALIAADS